MPATLVLAILGAVVMPVAESMLLLRLLPRTMHAACKCTSPSDYQQSY
jgi:hypothetical protein